MKIYEKIWDYYKANTLKSMKAPPSKDEACYDLMNYAEETEDGRVTIDFKLLDTHKDYDFEYVFRKDVAALYETEVLFEKNFTEGIINRTLESLIDDLFPQWREDWEIPNADVYSHLDMDDLREDIEYQNGALEAFMEFFGYYRFNDTEFWVDPSYKKPYYDDPNQLKLDFGV